MKSIPANYPTKPGGKRKECDMPDYCLTGSHEPSCSEDYPTIEHIAARLAGSGLRAVRLRDLQRAAVANALAVHEGNKTRAAHELGISVRTLQRQLKAWRASADDNGATNTPFLTTKNFEIH
jgi:DNA-binding NtrC family response regulator